MTPEDDLRQRLQEREEILQSISEVFFSVDHQFRYTFFNAQAEKVGGKPRQELIGKNMWEMFPFLKETEFHRQMLQAAADRKILIADYLGPITGGWFEMRIYPSAEGLSVLFVDISARKKAEEQLARATANLEYAVAERTRQLQTANEQLEELLYSIAHDLRAPLRSMQGFAEAFVEDFSPSLDAQAREYAARMTAAATFMDRMLRDLLEIGRVSKAEIPLEPVSLGEAVESALLQHAEQIKTAGARIDVAPDLGQALANPTLVAQIVANLVSNALKFARKGTAPEIKIGSAPLDPQTIVISVEDNGIGIEEKYREKVFRVFERLHGSSYEGTGIGLALAKKAAERMQGSLTFTSRVGEGTKFQLVLPALLP